MIVALIFIVGGFILLVTVCFDFYKNWNTGDWVEHEAVIKSTSVESSTVTSPSTGGSHTVYVPHIRYSYVVDGQKFENDRINFTSVEHATGYEKARKEISALNAGGIVKIYYNPKKISESVLHRKASIDISRIAIGFVFFIFGSLVLIKKFKNI